MLLNASTTRTVISRCIVVLMIWCIVVAVSPLNTDVKPIEDVAHKSSLSTLQSLVADITRVSKQLHTTRLEMSNDLKLIHNTKDSLLEEIQGLRKQFNIQLDEEQTKLEKEIGDNIKAIDDLIIAADKSKPDLTSHFDEKQIFITKKLVEVVLADVNNFLKRTNVFKPPKLKFEPNDILSDAIEKADRIGKINRIDVERKRIQRSNYTMTYMNEINVRVSSDKMSCSICDMSRLPDGTMLLIDRYNNKLKRLDDQLSMKDFLDLKAEPYGLCSVSPTEVAVRMHDNTIHFICVGKSLTYQRKVSINNCTKEWFGMVCCNKQLWIPGDGAVYVYSLSGSFVKKIEKDSQGRKIFPNYNPGHIAVSNDDTNVYVAAGNDRVVVFNNNGDVINELRDQRLNATSCVCVTEDDIVLVAGWASRNVVMFDKDGNSLGELVSSKDVLFSPASLCYDRERCRLLAGYLGLDKAHINQLS